ncbi:MAG: nuclear transport factor 2 family protein [Gemmatimonadota bacterium]
MRSRLATLTAATFVVLLAGPIGVHAQATQDTTMLPAAMRTARAGLNAALTSLKASEAAGFFADSAVAEFQGQTFPGKAAIEAWLTDALGGISGIRFTNAKFTVSPTEIIETSDYTVVTPDGEQPGATETTWRLVNGTWKVVRLRS